MIEVKLNGFGQIEAEDIETSDWEIKPIWELVSNFINDEFPHNDGFLSQEEVEQLHTVGLALLKGSEVIYKFLKENSAP